MLHLIGHHVKWKEKTTLLLWKGLINCIDGLRWKCWELNVKLAQLVESKFAVNDDNLYWKKLVPIWLGIALLFRFQWLIYPVMVTALSGDMRIKQYWFREENEWLQAHLTTLIYIFFESRQEHEEMISSHFTFH